MELTGLLFLTLLLARLFPEWPGWETGGRLTRPTRTYPGRRWPWNTHL